MIWVSGDTHLGHVGIIGSCNRPFQNVEEMNKTIIDGFNDRVGKNDIVYFLGDFTCNANTEICKEYMRQLKGKWVMIQGNHDRKKALQEMKSEGLIIKHDKIMKIEYGGRKMVLSHCPMVTWEGIYDGVWHIHGHTHSNYNHPSPMAYDVGVDGHNFLPISFDELNTIMVRRWLATGMQR